MPGYDNKNNKSGKTWQNREKRLPSFDKDNNPITYKEFDVNNTPPNLKRDSERFVRGSDGSVYYTDDHYKTFKKIK